MAENELTNQLTRIESMTNVELRAELKQRGCSTSGNKKDLLAKLRIALQKEYQDNSVGLTQTVIDDNDQINTSPILQDIYISSMPIISIPRVDVQSNILSTSEKNTRTRNKKSSIDSRTDESLNTTTTTTTTTINNQDNNSELNKSIEEKSHVSPLDNKSMESNADIENIPLANEQKTVNQPKNDVLLTTDEKFNSVQPISDDNKKDESTSSITHKEQELIKKDELPITTNGNEQVKPKRSQISSFIKSFNRNATNKINLSSELLKTLIPDINLISESIANAELDALVNDDNIGQSSNVITHETNMDNTDFMTIGDLADGKHSINRTVVMDANGNNDDGISKKKQTLTAPSNIADEPVRIKHVLATNEPPSEILYIRGLTRPFSLFQLKELLSRYGTLIDGEFWLDRIKSQCFVTYKTLDEAKNAREALDGCRWPSTNPKTLSIRFGRYEELQFSKTHDLSPDQMSVDSLDRSMQQQVHVSTSNRPKSPTNGMKSRSDVQESKKSKFQEQIHSGFLISEDEKEEEEEEEKEPETVSTNEIPAKDLDDYFRKTKAKPYIYWLPLTEEQIIERDHQAERRRAQREENASLSDKKSRTKRKRSSSPYRRR